MNKKLYIVAGHNGAGKTTFIKEFIKHKKLRYIDADEIAEKLPVVGSPAFSISAGKLAIKKIQQFKQKNKSFIVETTFSGKIWHKLLKEFKKSNYYITAFFIYLDSPEEAIKRISVRINKKGHYVSEDIVRRRYPRSIRNFWNAYKNLIDRWFILNNSEDVPSVVAYGLRNNFDISERNNFDKFLLISKPGVDK